jgi:ferrochelatase
MSDRPASGTIGVVVMAYGTPASPDDVEAYYTHVRRGRPPTPEQLADLQRRYDAIGGISPLLARTQAQVAGVQAALDRAEPGRFVCRLGQKHAAPFVEDAVRALITDGAQSIVGLVLAPHYSTLSVGEYHGRGAAAAGSVPYTGIESWHLEPGLVDLLATRLGDALARFPDGATVQTLITAHSLPVRILETGDPYPTQLEETGRAVTAAVGVDRWQVAWQSAGRTPEPWIGPDILDVIRELGKAGDVTGVVVCPAGFTSDHLEVLFDVDIEAQQVAGQAGLQLERTASLNDDPAFVETVASVVRRAVPS